MTTSCAVVSHERAFVGEAVRIVPDPGALRFSRVRQSIMRLHRSRHYKTVKGTARMAEGLVGRVESRSNEPRLSTRRSRLSPTVKVEQLSSVRSSTLQRLSLFDDPDFDFRLHVSM